MKIIEIPPSASRTLEGYSKGLGYKFETACADLIDNSLAVGSTSIQIEIKIGSDKNPSFATICDNGAGMDFHSLKEAMRLGTKKKYTSKADLGKYGLGLKTASLSQTDTLTVVTRSKKTKELLIARLDKDQIKQNDKWEIQFLEKKELDEWTSKLIDHQFSKGHGTLVILEKLHLLKNLLPDQIQEIYEKNEHELRLHLSMVFHRFLQKVKITINGSSISPWDPFCKNEKTKVLSKYRVYCRDQDGKKQPIVVRPYILPTEKDFSSRAAWEEASGPKRWNSQQGLYFYRKNRLLTSGGWSNCDGRLEEHQKLLRISVDFPEKLDELVNLNINKMQANIPNEIKKDIQNRLIDWRRMAEARYRSKKISPSQSTHKGRLSLFNFVNGSKLQIEKNGASIRVQYPIKHTPKKVIRLIQSNKTNQIISLLCLLLQSGQSQRISGIIKDPKRLLNMIIK